VRGYHKPIMIAGGLGNIAARMPHKIEFKAGALLIQLGGPGMLIGLGGGAASSMATGTNTADLDFASVQRGNPEIQRRAQEVIDRCWQMGRTIRSSRSTTSAPAASPTPCRNWRTAPAAARAFDLRAVPSRSRACRRARSGATRRRSATCWPSPRAARRVPRPLRARALPLRRARQATGDGQLRVKDEHFGNDAVDMPMEVLLGKPPRMHRNVARKPAGAAARMSALDLKEAAWRVLRLPAWPRRTSSSPSATAASAADRARPDGRPVAGAGGRLAVTTLGFDTISARPSPWASARRWRCSTRRPRAAWRWARR
jgi:phosphoribosylformylglycinamidine synthase